MINLCCNSRSDVVIHWEQFPPYSLQVKFHLSPAVLLQPYTLAFVLEAFGITARIGYCFWFSLVFHSHSWNENYAEAGVGEVYTNIFAP